MKLFNLSYNLIAQCLFLISLCAFITPTKSELTFFNYTETSLNDTNVPNQTPFVIKLDTYDEGTTLVHITRRDNKLNVTCTNYLRMPALGLEQIFRIRVIQLNGTVNEINLDLKLDPPNYCYGKTMP
ncbi:24104_t:CDS:1, partial [Gigaspora rosea]